MGQFEISPEELVEKMDKGLLGDAWIVDVREPQEWEYYHLEPSIHIPMGMIPDQLERLPKEKELYILCGHGVRSAMVCNYLIQQGYHRIKNVQGGIAAVAKLRGFDYD